MSELHTGQDVVAKHPEVFDGEAFVGRVDPKTESIRGGAVYVERYINSSRGRVVMIPRDSVMTLTEMWNTVVTVK